MGKKFSLADYANLVTVSEADRPEIVMIPWEKISANKENFYQVGDVTDLVNAIQMQGLLSPVVVTPDRSGPDGYVLIAGHRRHKAWGQLRKEDPDKYAAIPAIVRTFESESEARLALILSNSSARVLTPAEIDKQAQAVEMTFYELKEQGFEFPGRMRDHVAKAVKQSSSKLARLRAIRERLAECWRPAWEKGLINEAVAYRISQEHASTQKKLKHHYDSAGIPLNQITLGGVEKNIDMFLGVSREQPAAAKEARAAEAAAPTDADRSQEDAEFFRMLTSWAVDFLRRLPDGCSRGEGVAALKRLAYCYLNESASKKRPGRQLSKHGLSLFRLSKPSIFRPWPEVYDMLCSIAIQLAQQSDGQKEEPRDTGAVSNMDHLAPAEEDPRAVEDAGPYKENGAAVSNVDHLAPAWLTGEPERLGRYLCKIDMGNGGSEYTCELKENGWWIFGAPLMRQAKVLCWWPLPDE